MDQKNDNQFLSISKAQEAAQEREQTDYTRQQPLKQFCQYGQ